MRIEVIPLIAAAFVGLIGLGLIFDAWTPDEIVVKRERRRRARVERSRGGEASIGLGVMCMGAAFAGRDTWRYSVIAVMAGSVLLFLGAIANRRYLGAIISNRGALRRRPEQAREQAADGVVVPPLSSGHDQPTPAHAGNDHPGRPAQRQSRDRR